MRSLFLGGLVAVGALGAMVAVGCGDSGGGTGGGGTGGGGTGGSGPTSSVTGTGTTTSTGSGPCAEISAPGIAGLGFNQSGGYVYGAAPSPGLGGDTGEDQVIIEVYDEALTGSIDLGSGDNVSYSTCLACILAIEDATDTTGRYYFQSSGTLDLGATTIFYIAGSIDDVTLNELDPNTGEELAGGGCVHIAGQSFQIDPPVSGWTECPPEYYDGGDGDGCDCECGAVDPDCSLPDQEVYGCDEGQTCGADGTCEGGGGGGQGGGGGGGAAPN